MSSQIRWRLSNQHIHRLLAQCVVATVALVVWGCLPRESRNTDTVSATAVNPADNSQCLICHMDFKTEVLSAKHEKAGVGCTTCHGASLAHGDDELNITPPDTLFGRAEIAPFCKSCHPKHKTDKAYETFVKKWYSKRRPNGRMVSDDSVCTDCHGNHAVLRADQRETIPD